MSFSIAFCGILRFHFSYPFRTFLIYSMFLVFCFSLVFIWRSLARALSHRFHYKVISLFYVFLPPKSCTPPLSLLLPSLPPSRAFLNHNIILPSLLGFLPKHPTPSPPLAPPAGPLRLMSGVVVRLEAESLWVASLSVTSFLLASLVMT